MSEENLPDENVDNAAADDAAHDSPIVESPDIPSVEKEVTGKQDQIKSLREDLKMLNVVWTQIKDDCASYERSYLQKMSAIVALDGDLKRTVNSTKVSLQNISRAILQRDETLNREGRVLTGERQAEELQEVATAKLTRNERSRQNIKEVKKIVKLEDDGGYGARTVRRDKDFVAKPAAPIPEVCSDAQFPPLASAGSGDARNVVVPDGQTSEHSQISPSDPTTSISNTTEANSSLLGQSASRRNTKFKYVPLGKRKKFIPIADFDSGATHSASTQPLGLVGVDPANHSDFVADPNDDKRSLSITIDGRNRWDHMWLNERIYFGVVDYITFDTRARPSRACITFLEPVSAQKYKAWVESHGHSFGANLNPNPRVEIEWDVKQTKPSAEILHCKQSHPNLSRRILYKAPERWLLEAERLIDSTTCIKPQAGKNFPTFQEVSRTERLYQFKSLKYALKYWKLLNELADQHPDEGIEVSFAEEKGLHGPSIHPSANERKQSVPQIVTDLAPQISPGQSAMIDSKDMSQNVSEEEAQAVADDASQVVASVAPQVVTDIAPQVATNQTSRTHKNRTSRRSSSKDYRYGPPWYLQNLRNPIQRQVSNLVFSASMHDPPFHDSTLFWLSRNACCGQVLEIMSGGHCKRGTVVFAETGRADEYLKLLANEHRFSKTMPEELRRSLSTAQISETEWTLEDGSTRVVILNFKDSLTAEANIEAAFVNIRGLFTWGCLSETKICLCFLSTIKARQYMDLLYSRKSWIENIRDLFYGPDPAACLPDEALDSVDQDMVSRVAYLLSKECNAGHTQSLSPLSEEFIPGSAAAHTGEEKPGVIRYAGRWQEISTFRKASASPDVVHEVGAVVNDIHEIGQDDSNRPAGHPISLETSSEPTLAQDGMCVSRGENDQSMSSAPMMSEAQASRFSNVSATSETEVLTQDDQQPGCDTNCNADKSIARTSSAQDVDQDVDQDNSADCPDGSSSQHSHSIVPIEESGSAGGNKSVATIPSIGEPDVHSRLHEHQSHKQSDVQEDLAMSVIENRTVHVPIEPSQDNPSYENDGTRNRGSVIQSASYSAFVGTESDAHVPRSRSSQKELTAECAVDSENESREAPEERAETPVPSPVHRPTRDQNVQYNSVEDMLKQSIFSQEDKRSEDSTADVVKEGVNNNQDLMEGDDEIDTKKAKERSNALEIADSNDGCQKQKEGNVSDEEDSLERGSEKVTTETEQLSTSLDVDISTDQDLGTTSTAEPSNSSTETLTDDSLENEKVVSDQLELGVELLSASSCQPIAPTCRLSAEEAHQILGAAQRIMKGANALTARELGELLQTSSSASTTKRPDFSDDPNLGSQDPHAVAKSKVDELDT